MRLTIDIERGNGPAVYRARCVDLGLLAGGASPIDALRELVDGLAGMVKREMAASGKAEASALADVVCKIRQEIFDSMCLENEGYMHWKRAHPDYEYVTTHVGYDSADDPYPGGDWLPNVHAGRYGTNWAACSNDVEFHWMRRKADR